MSHREAFPPDARGDRPASSAEGSRNRGRCEGRRFRSLSCWREQRDVINGYQLGVKSYVRKPVDFKKFPETVKQLGLYWLLVIHPPARHGARAAGGKQEP